MKEIYIFLSKTNTFISRLISFGTMSNLTHVSLSLNKNFDSMYSFARKGLKPYPAGFKTENIRQGLFLKAKRSFCKIFSLLLSDAQYNDLLDKIRDYSLKEKELSYSYKGAFFCWLRIKKQYENKFFCSQFVSEILNKTTDYILPYAPELMRPKDILKINGLTPVYEGKISDLVKLTDSYI